MRWNKDGGRRTVSPQVGCHALAHPRVNYRSPASSGCQAHSKRHTAQREQPLISQGALRHGSWKLCRLQLQLELHSRFREMKMDMEMEMVVVVVGAEATIRVSQEKFIKLQVTTGSTVRCVPGCPSPLNSEGTLAWRAQPSIGGPMLRSAACTELFDHSAVERVVKATWWLGGYTVS
jgi:hypothetical protein